MLKFHDAYAALSRAPRTFVFQFTAGISVALSFMLTGALVGPAMAQEGSAAGVQSVTLIAASGSSSEESYSASNTLPDAPGYAGNGLGTGAAAGGYAGAAVPPNGRASRLAKTIEPGQTASRLTIGDKVLLGIRENATLTSVAGWVLSSAYEQVSNNSPNYGQTGKGYAQRLGAAAARNSSENIFSDSVIAPILHQDPRYYRMGSEHNFFKRLFYSGTRGVITRTDGGRRTFNFSNVGGDLAGSAVTQIYYPPGNRSFNQVMQTWGSSIGGDAVGYVVSEFLPDVLSAFHIKNADF